MRNQITPTAGRTLSNYLVDINQNFLELYRLVDQSEASFTGLDSALITTGTIGDDRIDPGIVRWQDLDDIPDLVLVFENKLI